MKAFLLAAGEGRRLRPITESVPKCLVPIRGTPLLALWLTHLARHKVKEVLINTHYLHEQVRDFVSGADYGVRIVTVHEERLLGSAGTVVEQRDFVAGEKDFFIIYADNLTDADLADMQREHRERKGILTMGLFRTDRPREKGIATLDNEGRIVEFTEKPLRPRSDLANAGIYIADSRLYDFLPAKAPADSALDFGFHVFPALTGRMHGYVIREYLLDIGTVESYKRAQREWKATPAAEHGTVGAGKEPAPGRKT